MNKAQGKCFVSKINLVMYLFVFVFNSEEDLSRYSLRNHPPFIYITAKQIIRQRDIIMEKIPIPDYISTFNNYQAFDYRR